MVDNLGSFHINNSDLCSFSFKREGCNQSVLKGMLQSIRFKRLMDIFSQEAKVFSIASKKGKNITYSCCFIYVFTLMKRWYDICMKQANTSL